jgi:hypothetical protein
MQNSHYRVILEKVDFTLLLVKSTLPFGIVIQVFSSRQVSCNKMLKLCLLKSIRFIRYFDGNFLKMQFISVQRIFLFV